MSSSHKVRHRSFETIFLALTVKLIEIYTGISKLCIKMLFIRNSTFEFRLFFSKKNYVIEFFSMFRKVFKFFEKKKSFQKPNFFFRKIFFCRSRHLRLDHFLFVETMKFVEKNPFSRKTDLIHQIIFNF